MTDYGQLFRDTFTAEVERQEEKSGVHRSQWMRGGKATKEWPNKADDQWWLHHGPEFIDKYIAWRQANPDWVLWEIGGEPAIELSMMVTLDLPWAPEGVDDTGVTSIVLKAIVDRLFVLPTAPLVVVDIKAGVMVPDDVLQLGLYALAVEKVFGVRPTHGCYYMARKGVMTPLVPLDLYSERYIATMFREYRKRIERDKDTPEAFLPKVSNLCNTCSVKDFCATRGGHKANGVDPLALYPF